MLESEAETLALAGSKRRLRNIRSVVVRAGGLQNPDGHAFNLRDLVVRVAKCYLYSDVSDCFVADVVQSSINVGDRSADEVLRLAHLQIAEL